MRAVALTDVGITRDNNEDFYIISENLSLFIVSDGMGGYHAGEIASELAANSVLEAFNMKQAFNFEIDVHDLLVHANEKIIEYVKAHPECRGMGTTIVVAYLDENHLWIANVGDSRCYGISQNGIVQLSEDHSLVAELVKIGSISPEEAERHPDRNVITSALGVERNFEVFIAKFDIKDYSHILLCSDGLSNMVSSQELMDVIKSEPFDRIPKTLIDLANQKGGKDNITAVCVEL
ncbi:MAG TPA: Stp1/IreP family PP2C-type Ser/Thr phosphatase [Clostridiales bacterium UBA8960]|nr:Stp1/IreP family PP2C-type Ser/Thr phosphatase [Clostridiales bacterium UBA8960]